MNLCTIGAAVLLFSASAQALPAQQKPKPFTLPPAFVLDNSLVAKDGCEKDFVKAASLEGMEQGKYLAELFAYGCIRILPGKHQTNLLDVQQYGAVSIRKVRIYTGTRDLICWVLTSKVISWDTINAALASLPKTRPYPWDDTTTWK
jgi:hypothetical protein